MKAVSVQLVRRCVYDKPQKIMQHVDGIIPNMFDCWADPVVHLLLPKSSTTSGIGSDRSVNWATANLYSSYEAISLMSSKQKVSESVPYRYYISGQT